MTDNTCLIERSLVRSILIHACEIDNDATQSLLAEVDRLSIVTMADKEAEIERLEAWIRRIDAMNDNPAKFNTEINTACRNALAGAALEQSTRSTET